MIKWVSYLLVILVAMQSVLAVADVHQIHQADAAHLEFAGDDGLASVSDDGTASDSVEPNQPTNTALDCQHCCHCHSPQVNFLSDICPNSAYDSGRQPLADLSGSVPSSHPSSLYRPPRV